MLYSHWILSGSLGFEQKQLLLPPLPFLSLYIVFFYIGLLDDVSGEVFLEDQHLHTLNFYNHIVNWRQKRINIERTRTFLFARGKNAN